MIETLTTVFLSMGLGVGVGLGIGSWVIRRSYAKSLELLRQMAAQRQAQIDRLECLLGQEVDNGR